MPWVTGISADIFCAFALILMCFFHFSGPLRRSLHLSSALMAAAACFSSPGPRHPSSPAYLSALVSAWLRDVSAAVLDALVYVPVLGSIVLCSAASSPAGIRSLILQLCPLIKLHARYQL